MATRDLGPSGLRVSAPCRGAMTFGEADDESFMHEVGCDEATRSRASLELGHPYEFMGRILRRG